MNGMGSHQSARFLKEEWLTPPDLLNALGQFDLDPCAPVNRPWSSAKRHFTVHDDGLLLPWVGRVWCHPPYGRKTGDWLMKCAEHKNCLALIFARTETKDWEEFVWARAHSILFLFGRLHFYHVDGRRADANSGAPSALISYDGFNTEVLSRSGIKGRLITL